MTTSVIRLCMILLAVCAQVRAQEESTVQYLGNEGVMVTHGDTSILFDPLFDNVFGQYQPVPGPIRDAIFAGEPPYDEVDAVFVSHFHGDHFSAGDLVRLLRQRSTIDLYAPGQAVAEMRRAASAEDNMLFERVTIFDLGYGDVPVFVRKGNLLIEALHVPHSGWPTRLTDVQNIAFRVTLAETSTIVHLGDADARLVHFDKEQAFWDERVADLALPPYWFLLSDNGRDILVDRIYARHLIGIHVPAEYGNDRSTMPEELLGEDLFTQPGEGRRFIGRQ